MKKRNLLPFQLFAACLVGLILGKFCFSTTKDKVELSLFNGKPSKLQSVMNIIENRYVDILDIDSLTELSIPDVLSHLDPHSSYVPMINRNANEKSITGKFCGVGIEYNIFNDTLETLYITPDGPAYRSGVRAGDKILAIDSVSTVGPNARAISSAMLRGERHSKVSVTIKRQGVDSLIKLTIIRDDIKVRTVTCSYAIDSLTAYIKITNFGDSTYNEFMRKVGPLKESGIKNLIIDLRNNGGGRVEQVRRIASEILNKGDTIAFTVNRDGNVEEMYIDTVTNGICKQMKIICMVNTNTASASEILAGAIQDNDRGIIIGRRTFGKGLVQTPIELNDGSLVRLTTYRYYTPSGRSLQKGYEEYTNDYQNRKANGELDSAGAYRAKDSSQYLTRNGRVVYSKGGINPDIFVPEPSSERSRLQWQMDSAYIVMRFASMTYAEELLKEPEAIKQDISDIACSRKFMDNMLDFARRQGVQVNTRRDKKEIEQNRERWTADFTGQVFHILGNDDEQARYLNQNDRDLETATEILANDSRYLEILKKETEE